MRFTLNDVGKLIAQSAPLLGSALAGSTGATIGSLIAAKFGGNSAQPDALHAMINADPQAAIKLKELEIEHQLALERLMIQAETDAQQTLANDRASARLREVGVDQSPHEKHDKTPAILAYCATGCVFFSLTWLFCFPIPPSNHDFVCAFISSLTTVWIGAMAYYHGSSAGSRMKDTKIMRYLQGKNSDDS
jgi:hypothetical protein